ncbi:hypothetical protein CH381_32570 [Leptospira sp. mixed culture ATI2-C-A1]|nr:hypothetical protein CH381_32570 [Leptospira sp. mixed culture ATI2-C-A1]
MNSTFRENVRKLYHEIISEIPFQVRPKKEFSCPNFQRIENLFDSTITSGNTPIDTSISIVRTFLSANLFTVKNSHMSFLLAYLYLRDFRKENVIASFVFNESANSFNENEIRQIVENWFQ